MPKLLVFVPCERVIISGAEGGDNSSSLIAILEGISVQQRVPVNAVAPIRWTIFSLWTRTPEDEGKEYEQVCQLLSPSGETVLEGTMEFRFTKRNQRNTFRISVLPIGEAGEYSLRLYAREKGKPETQQEYGVYPLTIDHDFRPESEPPQASDNVPKAGESPESQAT